MTQKLLRIGFLAILLIGIACNKASDFGSFLEEGSALPINFDEVQMTAHTVPGDSILSWSESIRRLSHVVGTLDDPIFGKSKAEIYWQFNLAAIPDFTGAVLDSMVLSVGFDTAAVGYGTYEIPQDIAVSRISEQMFRTQEYFTDRNFMVEPDPLSIAEDVIPNKDTSKVLEPRNLAIVTNLYGPQMRARLSDDFGNEFISYSDSIFDSNITFQETFFGLRLSPSEETGGMINYTVIDPIDGARMSVYFTVNDTMGQYNIATSTQSVIHNYFEHDPTGSMAQQYIDNGSTDDTLLFVQSMGGPAAEFVLTDLTNLEGSTVNSARLELTVAVLNPSDTSDFPPISQLSLAEVKDNGDLELVKDLADVFRGNEIRFFDGALQFDADDGVYRYTLNIPQHVQRILDGEATNRMILTTLRPVSEASRSIIYGPSHSKFGAKLSVTHTKLLEN